MRFNNTSAGSATRPNRARLAGSALVLAVCAAAALPSAGMAATPSLISPAPAKALTCKSTVKNISRLQITKVGAKQAKGAYSCAQANRVADAWIKAFDSEMPGNSLLINTINYKWKAVQSVDRNLLATGGGTHVEFAGPTGH